MAAMLQQSPVTLRAQQSPDSKKRFNQNQQEAWSYPQEWQQQQITHHHNNPYYHSYQQYPLPYMYQTPQPRPHRPRTQSVASNSSGSIQPQKSSSTPTAATHQQRQKKQHRPNDHHRRPKSTLIQRIPSPAPAPAPAPVPDSCRRRSSITSTSSIVSQSVSIRSEISLGAKLSLSKRLRKVFSVSSLRSSSSMGSLAGASSSNVSIATMDTTPDSSSTSTSSTCSPITPSTPQRSLRRRSFASLSTLFQKSTPSPSPQLQQQQQPSEETTTQQIVIPDKKDRPTLRVDTTQSSLSPPSTRKAPFKGRSPVVAPDSPNSSVSTRSPTSKSTKLHRLASELPSPTPSSSSTSSSSSSSTSYNKRQQQQQNDNDMNQLSDDFDDLAMVPPPVIGVHYGLPMHGSPRLKPAAHSSSSSLIDQVTPLSTSSPSSSTKRRLQFCPTVQVHETFAASDYDRRCDNNATCQKLTPSLALKIKQEINEYKLTEMDVHVDSRQYTQFFL